MASKENNVYSRFSFCGKVTVSKKVPFVKRDTYDKGEKISINFGIKAGNNLGYVKLEGFKNDEIKRNIVSVKSIAKYICVVV